MKKRGIDCVHLDISHKPADWLRGHFPNIHARCLELGIDIMSRSRSAPRRTTPAAAS